MKNKRFRRLILIICFISSLLIIIPELTTANTPVVQNPSFEYGFRIPDNWLFTTTNDPGPDPDFELIYPTTPISHSGSEAAGVKVLHVESGQLDYAEWCQYNVTPIFGEADYNLTVWVNVTDLPPQLGAYIGLRWKNETNIILTVYTSSPMPGGTSGWMLMMLTGKAPEDADRVDILLRIEEIELDGFYHSGEAYFDDVNLSIDIVAEIGGNSPADHGNSYDPNASPYNAMLQINITANAEGFNVNSWTIKAIGTGDDQNDISEVDLIHDQNSNGVFDTGETLLANGTYPSDNGTLILNTAHIIPKGQTHSFLVLYQMAHTSDAGETFQFNLTKITAMGLISLLQHNVGGTPILSAVKTTVGVLEVNKGDHSPADHNWTPDGIEYNILLQLELYARAEAFTLHNITIQASGTGIDNLDIAWIVLIKDNNINGEYDSADTLIASYIPYNSDNGNVTLNLPTPVNIPKWSTINYLIAYRINTNAVAGSTFRLNVTDIFTIGAVDNSMLVIGLEVQSSLKTIVYPTDTTVIIIVGAVIAVGIIGGLAIYFYRKP